MNVYTNRGINLTVEKRTYKVRRGAETISLGLKLAFVFSACIFTFSAVRCISDERGLDYINEQIESAFVYTEVTVLEEETEVTAQEKLDVIKENDGKMAEILTYPIDGVVTSCFGARENPFDRGESEKHLGIDIAPTECDDIMAYADGIVERVSYSDGYGNYVVINHENYSTLYAHCDKILKSEGEIAKSGEVIALAGQTGRATGKHLHFEVLVDGQRINPDSYLNKALEEG